MAIVAGGAVPAAAGTRVALVSGDSRPPIAGAVELALAKLGGDESLELLERDEIRRILQEQKLSVSGLVDAAQVIAVGRLVKADLFAVVDATAGDDSGGIVVFDSRTGVRYSDSAVPLRRIEDAAEAVVSAVQSAHRKHARQNQGLHTIGVLTVRNADLPRSHDGLCEAVGFLVERGLPRSPDVAVLERRRLERINQERDLPGAEDSSKLLASLSLLELQIGRGEQGGLKAIALIRQAGNDPARPVTAEVADMSARSLADALVDRLIDRLRAAPAEGTADPRQEAQRYDHEALLHLSHKRITDAVRAQEAAHALDPVNEAYADRLSNYLMRHAIYLFSPREPTMTKGGDRAWSDTRLDEGVLQTLLAAAHRSIELNQRLTRPSPQRIMYNMSTGMLCDRLRGFTRSPSALPNQPEIHEFLELCRRRSLQESHAWSDKAAADPRWLDSYTSQLATYIQIIKSASLDTTQYAECLSQIAERWLAVTRNWQPRFNTTDGGDSLTSLLHGFVKPTNWPWNCDEREFARVMAPQYAAMRDHSRPIIALYGYFGQIRSGILLETETEESAYRRFANEFRPLAESIITAPQPWHADRTRYAAYEAWRTAIDDMPGKGRHDFQVREVWELCDFAIRREEPGYKSLQQALWTLDRQMSLALIERALPVIDSPAFAESAQEKARLKSLLKTAEQTILVAQPELAKTAAKLPWTRAVKLFDLTGRGLNEIVGCVPDGDQVFAACLKFDQDRAGLQLVRIPLSGSPAEVLTHVDLELPAAAIPAYARPTFVTAMHLDDSSATIATDGAGIVVFPRKGERPRRIAAEHGLPSNNVQSMAVMEGRIYAGFSDGYLVAFDTKSNQCEFLASSRRKEKRSVFDDGDIFRVPTLVADHKRRRLVFVIGNNVWQLTPADGVIAPVLDLVSVARGRSEPKLTGATIKWSSPLRGDHVLVSNVFHAIQIDLSRDQAVELHAPEDGIFPTHPPHLVLDGSLWSGGAFSRLSLGDLKFQALPAPNGGTSPFRPTICLEAAEGGRQLVAADLSSIWRLDLAP